MSTWHVLTIIHFIEDITLKRTVTIKILSKKKTLVLFSHFVPYFKAVVKLHKMLCSFTTA